MAIYAYAANAEDFTTAGLAGELIPTSCTHEEYAGGASELLMEHPLDEWGKWQCLAAGVIIKAPTPVRTTPQFSGGSIVTQVEKWTVKTSASKADRCIYSDGQLRKRRCLVPGGTEVTVAGRNETVAKVKSGRYGNGYMKLSALNYEAAETIADDTDSIEAVEGAWSVRDQLFRIYKVEKSDDRVTAWAKRIFYDLAEIITDWHCTTPHTAQQALDSILGAAMQEHPFTAYTNSGNQRTGLYYERKNIAWALLDPEEGIAKQYGLECVRDDFELYFLTRAGMDRGTVIEYGKNLQGVSCEIDESGVATRVLPVGSDKDGKPVLLLTDPPWLTSEHADNYATAKMYVLQCSSECRVSDTVNYTQVRAKMAEEAQALLDGGCDMPTVSMQVDFINLGDTAEYAQYKDLERVFLYDRVTVRVARLGIDVQLDVVRTVFDCLHERYDEVELGALRDISGSIQAWQLPSDISGSKIRLNSVGAGQLSDGVIATRHLQAGSITAESAAIANAAIVYANIQEAAITQLSTDALSAVRARIGELAAGTITTDTLIADIATLAKAAITTANIETANIDWATINTLAAYVASVAVAQIASADIDFAKVKDLVAGTALVERGSADNFFFRKLSVTSAQMVDVTVGTLTVKAADGNYYQLDVDIDDGTVTATQVTVTSGEISAGETASGRHIIETDLTVTELSTATATATEALINKLTAQRIDVAELFALQATITQLESWIISANTINALKGQLSLWADDKISAAVGAVQVGGTNLVQYTGWYSSIGTGWTFTDNTGAFARYPASTGHPDIENSFGGNGFLYWNATSTSTSAGGAGKAWSSHFRVVPGEQYTVSLRYRATGLMCILTGRTAKNVDPTWAPDFTCPDTNNDTDFSATVTVPAGIVWMQVVLRCNTNSAGEVGRVKVERGNRATTWSPCPNDPSENVVIGSRIALTQERILLQSPEIYINVSGTAGDTTIDESGMTTPVVNSPSVAPRYTGPTAITVTQLTGKNKLNYTAITWTTGRRDSSGAFVESSVSHYSSAVSVSPSTTYTLSGSLYKDSKAFRLYYLQADGTWISQTAALDSSNIPYTFTTPANCRLIQIQGSVLVTLNDAQLELGSSATTYEPYTGIPLDGINAFRTLTDAFAALSGKLIPSTVTITLATDTYEPSIALLKGVSGAGDISVNLNNHTINGRIAILNSSIGHAIENGAISATGETELINLSRCVMVYIGNMIINGSSNAANGIACYYSRAVVEGCKFYNTLRCIASHRLSGVESVNNTGNNNTYGFRVHDGGRIAWKGTVPSYTTASQNDTTGIITPSTLPAGSSGGTSPSAPTGTTTVTASSVSTRTYQPSGSGWLTGDASIQQGRNAGYNHYGIIWFGTTGWSGKTIAAATLTLRRLSGGAGSGVTVRLKTVTVSSASGDPNNSATDYGAIGTIEQGQTAAFSLPVAAVQAIASGNAKGFMLYSDDSSNWGDRSFSRNYAMFAGSGNSSYKPSLSVTYNT